jgi:uncharacterized integral membrane protein
MTRFSRKSGNKSPASILASSILLTISIVLVILLIQNWQTALVIYFLGQKTYALPFSSIMLIAFVGGGVVSLFINLMTKPSLNSDKNLGKNIGKNPINNSTGNDKNPAQNNYQSPFEDDDFDDEYDDDFIDVKYTKK